MSSGVAVNDEALNAYNELKLGRNKVKFVIYKISDDKTQIVVEEKSSSPDYDDFLAKLPEKDCRYAVYDFEYELAQGEGKRNKIVFFTWAPDTAPIRAKMLCASSKDALRKSLNGVASEVQGTDFSEVSYESVLERVTYGTH